MACTAEQKPIRRWSFGPKAWEPEEVRLLPPSAPRLGSPVAAEPDGGAVKRQTKLPDASCSPLPPPHPHCHSIYSNTTYILIGFHASSPVFSTLGPLEPHSLATNKGKNVAAVFGSAALCFQDCLILPTPEFQTRAAGNTTTRPDQTSVNCTV